MAVQPDLRPGRVQALLGDRCTTAWKPQEEIVPLGCQGSYGIVSAYVRKKRTSPRLVTAQPSAPQVMTRWILSCPESLTETKTTH